MHGNSIFERWVSLKGDAEQAILNFILLPIAFAEAWRFTPMDERWFLEMTVGVYIVFKIGKLVWLIWDERRE